MMKLLRYSLNRPLYRAAYLALIVASADASPSHAVNYGGIVPVDTATGLAAPTYTPSLSPNQFGSASTALTGFTAENPGFTMPDVANFLTTDQGLSVDQSLELAIQSSMNSTQIAALGDALVQQGGSITELTTSMQRLSSQFPTQSLGAVTEMANLGTISGAQFGNFAEGFVLQNSSISDILGGAGNLSAGAQQAIGQVSGAMQQLQSSVAAEAMGAMNHMGTQLTNSLTNALPTGLMDQITGLMGGLQGLLGGIQLPGFGGGFGGFGGGGSTGSASNYDNSYRNVQLTR